MAPIWPHLIVRSSLGAAEKCPDFSVPGFIKKSIRKRFRTLPTGQMRTVLERLIQGSVQALTNLGKQRDHVMHHVVSRNCLLFRPLGRGLKSSPILATSMPTHCDRPHARTGLCTMAPTSTTLGSPRNFCSLDFLIDA